MPADIAVIHTTAGMRVPAEPVFPFPVHPSRPFLRPLIYPFYLFVISFFYLPCLLPLWATLGSYGGDDVGMDTSVEDTASREQTRQQRS